MAQRLGNAPRNVTLACCYFKGLTVPIELSTRWYDTLDFRVKRGPDLVYSFPERSLSWIR